jgi:hypothetical protein
MHVFQGPYTITKLLDHLAYELRDERGKLRGGFNKKQLRQYREADDETQNNKQICICEAEGVAADARMNERAKDKNKE